MNTTCALIVDGSYTKMSDPIHEAARILGRKGGQAKSERKTKAVRENAKKGGWPKGKKRGPRKPKD
jgi:hypothetical protein